MAAVVGQYTILEQYYLNQSFAKALSMDTHNSLPGTALTKTAYVNAYCLYYQVLENYGKWE